jgi:hypothetical protein
MASSDIQKDIISAIASEVRQRIVKDIGDRYFCLLVDEVRDESTKEQMCLVLRYVDANGSIQERLLDMVHVQDTRSESLKSAIVSTLGNNALTISRVRGQGYDGASNMRGVIGGLKALIQQEVPEAHYVHCFAHRLQLALMSAAKNNLKVSRFFGDLISICVVVSASCKRADQFREEQSVRIRDAIASGEFETGRGLNQERSLRRAGDTRWGSHYLSLCRLLDLFDSAVKVLEIIVGDGVVSDSRGEASRLLEIVCTYDFVLMLHLMKAVMSKTAVLCDALQRKDQDIVNAMDLVAITKQELLEMRSDIGWKSLLDEIDRFCNAKQISVTDMGSAYVAPGRPRRDCQSISFGDHFRVNVYFDIIDTQLADLNERFSEQSSTLLRRIGYLNPNHLLGQDNVGEIVELAKMYPSDFSVCDLALLEQQLRAFRLDLQSNAQMGSVSSLSALVIRLVELNKAVTYHLVFRIMTLALTLPVSTASSERSFSALKIVKTKLRNKIGDEFLSNLMVLYVEKDLAQTIDIETIINKFGTIGNRRLQLK